MLRVNELCCPTEALSAYISEIFTSDRSTFSTARKLKLPAQASSVLSNHIGPEVLKQFEIGLRFENDKIASDPIRT